MNSTSIVGESIFRTRVGSGGNVSRRIYNLVLGSCLVWGFIFNFLICEFFGNSIYRFVASSTGNYFIFIIGYLILAIAGIIINNKSDNPAISFLGYNMIVLPLGAVLSICLQGYSTQIISYAFGTTAIVTALMICLSVAFPNFFLSIGRGLFIALLCVILVEFVGILIFHRTFNILDFAVVLLFCGYIGFDWARSQKLPSTIDNAIDCSCALYVDIINLFLRLLRIFGRSR